jgi:hypothetical protein
MATGPRAQLPEPPHYDLMTEGNAGSAIPRARRAAHRRWLPFWALQFSEIAVALVFVDISVHVHKGGLLVASAIAFTALAVTAQGPLGIVRICGKRLHLILIVAAAVVVGLMPIIPGFRPDIEGIIVLEFGAVGLIRIATLTQTADSTGGRTSARRSGSAVIDTTATVVDSDDINAPQAGRPGGSQAPGSQRTSPATAYAARWAGRTTGAAAATGKQVAAKYGPEAEAQVKRGIRGAGRLAGKMAARLTPRDNPPD